MTTTAPTDRFIGLEAQAARLAAGEVTSAELVDEALRRIERTQPTLNAFRRVRAEQARAEARAADERLAAGERTALLGVPVAIKDDLDLTGEPTAFGCAGDFPAAERDAELVRLLRASGAVIVGKTNTPELGLWPITEGEAFGVTRNPWHLDHTPGGSSGGSAAAVAAGLVPAAIGSDGAGSIRIPARWTHLVGIKPRGAARCRAGGVQRDHRVGPAGPHDHRRRAAAGRLSGKASATAPTAPVPRGRRPRAGPAARRAVAAAGVLAGPQAEAGPAGARGGRRCRAAPARAGPRARRRRPALRDDRAQLPPPLARPACTTGASGCRTRRCWTSAPATPAGRAPGSPAGRCGSPGGRWGSSGGGWAGSSTGSTWCSRRRRPLPRCRSAPSTGSPAGAPTGR